ncbi:hypothetical protein AVEN_123395-1 [Araneus ventricosus]|uniref:Uncharacterized protein n=1 Tax=Araneus ventricosus TaxID=182803 RepID=A0A4Y2LIA5_ARAVE|nr:hypothetical protein AVEN_123395-1 [Araneus ventricosus]
MSEHYAQSWQIRLQGKPLHKFKYIWILAKATTSTYGTESEEDLNEEEKADDESKYVREFSLKGLNESLQSIEESPVKHWRFSESNYCKNKFQKVDDAVCTKVFNIHEQQSDPDYCTHEKCEILQQL